MKWQHNKPGHQQSSLSLVSPAYSGPRITGFRQMNLHYHFQHVAHHDHHSTRFLADSTVTQGVWVS